MADSNTASSLPGPDAGGNQPNLNVVPDAPPVEHRGRQNKAVAEVLSYAGEICVAAKLPGGLYARSTDISTDPGARSGQKLRLRTGGALIEIPIGAVDYEALRTLFPWTEDGSAQRL